MSKGTTIKAAMASWESSHEGQKIGDAEKVELLGVCPPIEKMDAGLAVLKNCRHLALSTNSIEKISNLVGLENLKILSLGRNIIKKLEALDPVAPTLEELWISYNLLEKFTGIEKLTNLKVLFASNNKIKEWAEVERLKCLPALENLLLAGNPLHQEYKEKNAVNEYRIEVLKRLPGIKRLDGAVIDGEERDAALAAQSAPIS